MIQLLLSTWNDERPVFLGSHTPSTEEAQSCLSSVNERELQFPFMFINNGNIEGVLTPNILMDLMTN